MPKHSVSPSSDTLSSSFSASYAGVVAFLTVAKEGSFAKAAERLGVGRSAVSRSVQRLEDHLGVRLLSRTTRSTSLTSEGELFLENCRPAVESIMQAFEEVRDLRDGPPKGQLRITAPQSFGRRVIAPILQDFRSDYPLISIELTLDDRPIDLAVDGVDVLFRDGRLEDSQIVAKQIIPLQRMICASAEFATANGLPSEIEQLGSYPSISRRSTGGRIQAWDLRVGGKPVSIIPKPGIVYNDDELVLQAALDGYGLAQLPAFQACDLIAEGRLVACLAQYAPDDGGHYVCYLSRRQLPKRIRVFIDYITARVRSLDLACGMAL